MTLSFFAHNRNHNSGRSCSPAHVISNFRSAWTRLRSQRASDLLCRLGAYLGNWNDRVRGQHVRRNFAGAEYFDRPLSWHVVDRVASWLYVAPERRRP